jgi:hypothetical protein
MKSRTGDPRENAYPPRGMRRETAAWYTGFSATKFDELVADGRMPKGKAVDGCVLWDRFQLDEAFTELMTGGANQAAWSRVA